MKFSNSLAHGLLFLSLSLPLLLANPASAQEPSATATETAAQAVARLNGGALITSIRLSGTVTDEMGSPRTGTAVLEAEGGASSRVEYDFPSGSRIELRGDDSEGTPWGAWFGAGQGTPSESPAWHAMALHNCWTPATWFLPRLSVLTLTHANDEIASVASTDALSHFRHDRLLAHQQPRMEAEIQRLSSAEIAIDTASAAPVWLRFNVHPDRDAGREIPVEIRFSSFQRVQGTLIPFHIQKYMQNALVYDIEIENVEINPSLPASDFAEPEVVAAQLGGVQ